MLTLGPARYLRIVTSLAARLLRTDAAPATGHITTRTFAAPRVAPGDQMQVTIAAQYYGAFAQVEETLPEGFGYPHGNSHSGAHRNAYAHGNTLAGTHRNAYAHVHSSAHGDSEAGTHYHA